MASLTIRTVFKSGNSDVVSLPLDYLRAYEELKGSRLTKLEVWSNGVVILIPLDFPKEKKNKILEILES